MKTARPIRILHVVTSMNRAGLETMLMNYYRNIDRSKVQFDFLVHRSTKGDYDNEIIRLGGKIHHFAPITLKSIPGYSGKMKLFLQRHPEYKVVHSHLDALSSLPLSGAKHAGVPVRIAHSHNNGFSFDIKYLVRLISKKLITRYATDLFACSDSAGKFMFGENSKFSVVKNAIDTEKFAYNKKIRNMARRKLKIDEMLVIGHIGRFSHQKNHDFLVDIFAQVVRRHKQSALLLIGVGETERTIREKVNSLGLQDKVMFLGSRSDISELMQAMDVFLLPSRYEGLGIVAIEAQTSGLPCVVSAVAPNDVVITGNTTLRNLDEGADSWANLTLDLARNTARKDHRRAVRDAGYSIGRVAKQLEEKYMEMAR